MTFGNGTTNWKRYETGFYRLENGILLHAPALLDGTREDTEIEVDFYMMGADDIETAVAIGTELEKL